MNKRLNLAVRNAACTACKLHTQADGLDRCVTGQGPNDAPVVVVTKMPMDPGSRLRAELETYLRDAGLDITQVLWCSALKCRTWDIEPSKSDLKTCSLYMRAELAFVKPRYILALGSEAWFAVSGWADVTKHRGQWYDAAECDGVIFPTISPAAVARSPGMRQGFEADLRYFAKTVNGQADNVPFHMPSIVHTVDTRDGLRSLVRALRAASVVAYDVETAGDLYAADGAIVSISFTTATDEGMPSAEVWQVPLFHPESPFERNWRKVLSALGKAICAVPKRVGHNAKFDSKWMWEFGVPVTPTADTIVMLALLDENQPKGLKPACQQRLGADPWGIDTRNLLTTPLAEVLEYNGLDTWHDLRLYYVLREELHQHKRLFRLFVHLMMPLIQELIPIERNGVYVDGMALAGNWGTVQGTLAAIHEQLMAYVPSRDQWPDGIKDVNFNASNFARWWLFEYLGLPVLARGKTKDDGSPGAPSMAEDLMSILAEQHPAAKLMVERVEWNKYDTSFFRPWSEQMDRNGRIHTVFKPWGTRTGRLSSGKEDGEKITAGARQQRGVNLQQVPRNKLARGVFGAPRGSSFVEFDYSQIELRLAAWLANEPAMLRLYASGQDIHLAMAMTMTGKPASQITAEERKRAKAVNFGFLYGMGWFKFTETAWSNYGLKVDEHEARAARTAFFRQFPALLPWHGKQRRLATKYGRVETPMGRIRHLPDIYSPSQDVRAEAERQAINSPVQSMASDMAALSMVHVVRRFRTEGLTAFPVGLVHDAVNYEIPDGELAVALPVIKDTMENLPLRELFGIQITVPIVADCKVGTHWGMGAEVPKEAWVNTRQLKLWLKEKVPA